MHEAGYDDLWVPSVTVGIGRAAIAQLPSFWPSAGESESL